MNFGQAVQELGPNATFEEKKQKVVDYITTRLQDVHQQGKFEYDKKQTLNGNKEEGDFVNSFGNAPSINVGTKSNPERVFKKTDKDGKTYYVRKVDGVDDESIKFYNIEDLQAYAG
jgi:hypothetical protein